MNITCTTLDMFQVTSHSFFNSNVGMAIRQEYPVQLMGDKETERDILTAAELVEFKPLD